MKELEIIFDQKWQEELINKTKTDGPWCSYNQYKLGINSGMQKENKDFYKMRVMDYISSFTPLDYQLQSAQKVIEFMNGKAILADEVGLGKTIVSGLVLKEYMIRSLVKKVLILVPASLVSQWIKELYEKFHISAVAYKKNMSWLEYDVIVATLDLGKREKHRSEICKINYDMVIIDEAHKLKNHRTQNHEFVKKIKKKYCLLLTATPIQNRLEEVFSLVTLLKPGLLGSYDNFIKRFSSGKISTENRKIIQQLLQQVMIRNNRKNSGLSWTKRHVETLFIDMSSSERILYDAVSNCQNHSFSNLLLQKEACSSREAVFYTLKKMDEEVLLPYVDQVECNSKGEKLVEIIKKMDDKVLVFTEYRATQMYLQWLLKQHGIQSVPFRGDFKSSKKDWMKNVFENQAQVMIATEAGSEGINLQFCNNIINFDLPWNPMKLEQRIGRIHRYGQKRDVYIYHFVTKNTIEEKIMRLLYSKIDLFEKIIGELDDILVKLEFNEFERHIIDIMETSETEGEMQVKINNLIEILRFTDDNPLEDIDNERGRNPAILG